MPRHGAAYPARSTDSITTPVVQIANLVDPHCSYTRHYRTLANDGATSDVSVDLGAAVIMSISRADDCVEQTHDDDDRFAPPSSAQVNTPSGRAINPHPSVSLATAAPARRAFFDPWNSSSTGHQRAENRLSSSTSWRVSRSLKLGEQYKDGLTSRKRVAYTVGAGRENSSKDAISKDGGWEKGAKGLRTSGQQSLTEIWGARKASKKCAPKEETLQTERSIVPDHGTLRRETKCTLSSKHLMPYVRPCNLLSAQ